MIELCKLYSTRRIQHDSMGRLEKYLILRECRPVAAAACAFFKVHESHVFFMMKVEDSEITPIEFEKALAEATALPLN